MTIPKNWRWVESHHEHWYLPPGVSAGKAVDSARASAFRDGDSWAWRIFGDDAEIAYGHSLKSLELAQCIAAAVVHAIDKASNAFTSPHRRPKSSRITSK
jgi:hypothetical protein